MTKSAAPKPGSRPYEERLEGFGKELEALLAKWNLRISLSAELRPASTDGTLGITPVMHLNDVA